jgi:protein tyrosine/serine phosphatase
MDANADRRAVRWDGWYNTRDLGGLPTTDGAVTRFGRLYRSADTRFITAAGWAAALEAGVRVILDLRNPDEVEPGGEPTVTAGTGMFVVPATEPVAERPGGIEGRLISLDDIGDAGLWRRLNAAGVNGTPLYFRPFLEAKPERVAAVLTAIARVPDGGVVFHCGGGRDRTGLVSLLLLALAGVTPEAIAADYALTFGQISPLYARLGAGVEEPDLEAELRERGTSVAEAITGLVRDLNVPGYLAAAGVSAADLSALAGRLR